MAELRASARARLGYRFGLTTVYAPDAPMPGYFAQIRQDYLLDTHVFSQRCGGVFVDVGAHDGRTLSNTYFLEQQRGWTGVCIEPNPAIFQELSRCRSSVCVNAAVGEAPSVLPFRQVHGDASTLSGLEQSLDRRALERLHKELADRGGRSETIDVEVRRLDHILQSEGVDHVDLLSIDVEGGEVGVLRSVDLTAIGRPVVVVENNHRSWSIARELHRQGYQPLLRLRWDEVYIPYNAPLGPPS